MFDQVDKNILRELQRDGSVGTAALAERVGASQASCWRRIRALEESGVLSNSVRLIEPEMLGLSVNVICNVRLRDHGPKSSAAFRAYVVDLDEILECFSMSGEWDYLLRIVSENVRSYEDFLMTKLLSHPTVATAASHFALSTVKFTTALPLG